MCKLDERCHGLLFCLLQIMTTSDLMNESQSFVKQMNDSKKFVGCCLEIRKSQRSGREGKRDRDRDKS